MESTRMRWIFPLLIILSPALWLAAGCSSDEARSIARTEAGQDGATEAAEVQNKKGAKEPFQAQLTLCRKVSRKSGRPIGEGDQFVSGPKTYVNALLDFSGVELDRTYVVHLVWVKPDGKKSYHRYGEIRQEELEAGGRRTHITWLDAEDLHKIKRQTKDFEGTSCTLSSRFNTSLSKERVAGQYELRVYLDRRFLLSKSFQLEVPVQTPTESAT